MTARSPIAIPIPGRTTDIVERKPWGVCLHTTGGGITAQALRQGRAPASVAIRTYLDMQHGSEGYPWGGPGYVIDHDGTIYQLADDTTRTSHIGSIIRTGPARVDRRAQYLSGDWLRLVSPSALALWRRAWPGRRSPQSLFPSERPNTDYVGVELIPCGDGFGTPWRPYVPTLRFTEEQHVSVAHLCADLAERHGFPDGWARGGLRGVHADAGRLVGHEDVGLLDRSDADGGWDPGALRNEPYFHMAWVRGKLSG